jgi:hypothetical protein
MTKKNKYKSGKDKGFSSNPSKFTDKTETISKNFGNLQKKFTKKPKWS